MASNGPGLSNRTTLFSDTGTAAAVEEVGGRPTPEPPAALSSTTTTAQRSQAGDNAGKCHPRFQPQRQRKRPRTDCTPIPTILAPTERARLPALDVHTRKAEATAPGPSTACAHSGTNDTTPGSHEQSAAQHAATPISAPSVHPSHNGNRTTAPQPRPECPHAPPETPAYAARGTQGCKAVATAFNVATTPLTMAAQVPPSDGYAAHTAPPTQATLQARFAESELRPHNDPGNATPTIDAALTEDQDSETSGTTPPLAAHPGPAPSWPGPRAENMHRGPDDDASGDNPSTGTLAAQDREIMPRPPPRPPHLGDHLDAEELRGAYEIYHRTPSQNLVDAL